jgi:putative flippase GtrA
MDRFWKRVESIRLYKILNENRLTGIIFNREMIMYLFVGALTTAVAVGSFWLFNRLFSAIGWQGVAGLFRDGQDYAYIDSNVLSWICAVFFGFVTNKLYVFNSRSREKATVMKEMAGFFGARLTTLLIDTGLMFLFVSIMSVNEMIAKLIVQVVVVVLNYVFSKLFVFKAKDDVA